MSETDGKVPTAAQQRLDVPEPPVRPRKGEEEVRMRR